MTSGAFQIGNNYYSFGGAGLGVADENLRAGYFTVMKGSSADNMQAVKITSAEMLFLVYAMSQIRQSEKVEAYSAITSALADLASAASSLNKNFSLMTSAFDGEYWKQSLAPDGSMALDLDVDFTKNDKNNNTDVNTRYGLMSQEMVIEVIRDYAALVKAHNTLTSAENKAVLEELGISIDGLPKFPLESSLSGALDFNTLLSTSATSLTEYTGTRILAKNLSSAIIPDDVDSLLAQQNAYIKSFDLLAAVDGEHFFLYSSDGTAVGVYNTVRIGAAGKGSFTFSLDPDTNQIDLDNEDNLAALARYVLLSTNGYVGTDGAIPASNGAMLTASAATNLKETYNNLMNKTNTSTQSMTQYSSRAVSTLESMQSMVQNSISSIFDTFQQIAQGY